MSLTKDSLGITLDIRALANLMCQDPWTRSQLQAGVKDWREGKLEPTTKMLGAANLNGGEGDEGEWFSFFTATDRSKQPGDEGLFYRNRKGDEPGNRVNMRLKRQKKNRAAASIGEKLGDSAGAANIDAQTMAAAVEALRKLGFPIGTQAAPESAQAAPAKTAAESAADDILDLF